MCDKELKVPALGRENIKVSRKKEMKKVSTLRKYKSFAFRLYLLWK